jgi:hypothetical protein
MSGGHFETDRSSASAPPVHYIHNTKRNTPGKEVCAMTTADDRCQ